VVPLFYLRVLQGLSLELQHKLEIWWTYGESNSFNRRFSPPWFSFL
jgi:hypothetical protein